jgi:hypothetical protein
LHTHTFVTASPLVRDLATRAWLLPGRRTHAEIAGAFITACAAIATADGATWPASSYRTGEEELWKVGVQRA